MKCPILFASRIPTYAPNYFSAPPGYLLNLIETGMLGSVTPSRVRGTCLMREDVRTEFTREVSRRAEVCDMRVDTPVCVDHHQGDHVATTSTKPCGNVLF